MPAETNTKLQTPSSKLQKRPKRQSSKGPSAAKSSIDMTNNVSSLVTQSIHGSVKRLDKVKPPLLKQSVILKAPSRDQAQSIANLVPYEKTPLSPP